MEPKELDLPSFTTNKDKSSPKESFSDCEVMAQEGQNEPLTEGKIDSLEGQESGIEEPINEPEQQKGAAVEAKTETKKTRSRRTGTDREKAEMIRNYVISGNGSLALRTVKSTLKVGDKLVRKVYSELINEGHLMQTESKRYKRVG